MRLFERVGRTIAAERMLQPGEPVCVAVSGGVDSMVLLDVLDRMGHPCHVLHVDHGLRGARSAEDARAVVDRCRERRLPCEVLRPDVRAEQRRAGGSVQMAARRVRMTWLTEKAREKGMRVALAHHADDALETALMHWLRGPGTAGWSGIQPTNGSIIRPLIEVRRQEIEAYARQRSIPFREDESNGTDAYLRNRIRHHLVPLLDELRAGGSDVMIRSLPLLRELEDLGARSAGPALEEAHVTDRLRFATVEGSGMEKVLLHRWLSPLGFHPEQQDRMLEAMAARRTGSVFNARDRRLVLERDAFVLATAERPPRCWRVEAPGTWPEGLPIGLSVHEAEHVPAVDAREAMLVDIAWLDKPWELRTWRPGDRMRPAGFGGSRSIADMLTDAKVPHLEKERALVLSIDGTIAWLPGHRAAQGFAPARSAGRVVRVFRKDRTIPSGDRSDYLHTPDPHTTMLPSLALEVPKEALPALRFPRDPVNLHARHRTSLQRKIHQAMVLGNSEHCKCRILFKDNEGLKYVETTVWSADKDRIVLKSGISLPVGRVIDVELV